MAGTLRNNQEYHRTKGTIDFDPAQIGDPVALQTAWSPAKTGGSSFCTHRLVEMSPYRLEFRSNITAKLIFLIFGLIILAAGVLLVKSFLAERSPVAFSFDKDKIWLLYSFIWLLFFFFLGFGVYRTTIPVVFDRATGFVWKGWEMPADEINRISTDRAIRLDQIHALQIIPDYHRSSKGSSKAFYSFELNLIRSDGTRVNLVDHGDRQRLRDDADRLSNFLSKPLWDATPDSLRHRTATTFTGALVIWILTALVFYGIYWLTKQF